LIALADIIHLKKANSWNDIFLNLDFLERIVSLGFEQCEVYIVFISFAFKTFFCFQMKMALLVTQLFIAQFSQLHFFVIFSALFCFVLFFVLLCFTFFVLFRLWHLCGCDTHLKVFCYNTHAKTKLLST